MPSPRYLTYHTQPISCMALSSGAHIMAAAALAPEPGSQFADVCLWDMGSGERQCTLQYHPQAVQVRALSRLHHMLQRILSCAHTRHGSLGTQVYHSRDLAF